MSARRPAWAAIAPSIERPVDYMSANVMGTVAALDLTDDGQAGHRVFNVGEARTISLACFFKSVMLTGPVTDELICLRICFIRSST